jgi:hypothetical protein
MTDDDKRRLELLQAVLPEMTITVDADGIALVKSPYGGMITVPIERVELVRWAQDKRQADVLEDGGPAWACHSCGHEDTEDAFYMEDPYACPMCGSGNCFEAG